MTWGWSVRNDQLGTPEEAKIPGAWPDYEAQYLKHRLMNVRGEGRGGRFNADGLVGEAERNVYLEKVSSNYKDEAEECLKDEFGLWLQGKHRENSLPAPYINEAGKPVRRHVFRNGTNLPGDEMVDWDVTPWGQTQLTHLPGVRDYLRSGLEQKTDAELKMNLLAEHGPQDLEEAWMYFKHWVKGRPVGVDSCLPNKELQQMGNRSNFGPQAPDPDPYVPARASNATTSATGPSPQTQVVQIQPTVRNLQQVFTSVNTPREVLEAKTEAWITDAQRQLADSRAHPSLSPLYKPFGWVRPVEEVPIPIEEMASGPSTVSIRPRFVRGEPPESPSFDRLNTIHPIPEDIGRYPRGSNEVVVRAASAAQRRLERADERRNTRSPRSVSFADQQRRLFPITPGLMSR